MRNTICATLTAITLTLCTALAGCGSASEPSTPAHAVRSVDSQCSAGAGDYAQAMSLRTGEPAKVFHAETGLVAFTVRPTTKDTK